MKYGYFKPVQESGLQAGVLAYNYNRLKMIPNIKPYYDYKGSGSPFFYKLLKKINANDSLYIMHLKSFGKDDSEVFKKISELRKIGVKLIVRDKEINLDDIFYAWQVRELYKIY